MKNTFSKFINLQGKYLTSLLFVLFFAVGQMWGAQNVTFGTAVGTKGYVYSSSTVANNTMLTDKCVYYSSAKNTVSLSNSKIIAYRLSLIFELSSSAKVDAVIGKNKDKNVSYVLYSLTSTQYDFIKSMSGVSNDVASAYVALDASHSMKTLFKDANITANDASRQKLLSAVDVANVTTKLYTSDSYATSTSAATTIPIWKAATGDNKDVLTAGYYAIYIDCGSSSGNTLDNLTFTAVASGYSVTYEENGHGANQTDLTNQTALPDPLPTLSESGWTFDGWYLDNNTFNTAATAGAAISQNTTLYAKWTAVPSADVCPSDLTIDGAQAYTEGDNIELTAGLSAGNGTIVYQWYKGSIASGNEVGTNNHVLTINSCSTSDAGNYYCVASKDGCSDAESSAYTVAVAEVTKYTVTLVPAGGTISDATGWTADGGNYTKEVVAGTELTLPTFTKENRTFKTWRNGVPADVASPVTVNANMTLTAVWSATIESVLYSWESPAGTAIETGGTAITKDANENTVDGNPNVNATLSNVTVAYKAIMLNGKISSNAWSGNYVQITTTEAVKTGDKVKVTACTTKGDTSKKGSAQMRAGTSATSTAIFTDGNSYNDIYADNTLNPNTKTFTVPDGVNTSTVTMTRSQTSTNCWVTKLQILRPTQVEEANLRTVTFDANGGSAVAAVEVASGSAVAQPADPTKAHCRFNGWKLNSAAYDFSSAVTSNITLVADWIQLYTISFAAGDGSGDAPAAVADKAQGETFPVPANTFTAPASKEFDKWNDGTTDYAPGDTYTVGTANVVLTAQWKALVAKYTVIFKDGDVTLDTKLFDVGSNPSDAEIDKTKPLFTFAAWQKDEADIALDDAFWATVAKDAEVTLTARWAKAYGNNVDFEAYIHANNSEKDDVDKAEAYVLSQNYALSTKTGTTFDANSSTNNGAYEGLKIKNSGTVLSWNVAAGKVVEFKAGVMVANGSLSINGGAATTIDGGTTGTGDNFKIHYFYSAAEALYEFTTSNGSAEVVKAITMRDPYQVLFDDNGADNPVAPQYAYPSVTLPSATKGTESFLGWFDDATAGNKIGDAGASYTPTAAAVTLYAHWEAISTDNTLSDLKVGGVTVDGFDPAVPTYYYELPYGTAVADIPVISATANSAKAKQVAIQQAVWTGEPYNCYRAQANVQAEDESWGYYDVRFSFAPKDGVSIIKVATTGGSNKTVTGAYAGDGDVNLSSSKKMDNGKYIGFILDGTTLQAGDRINVHTTQAANTGGSHIIFYGNMTDKNELYDTEEIGGAGDNIFTINAAMVGATTAYVYRSNADAAHQWNGYVDYIEVLRAMNPVLTAITLDGVAAEKGTGNAFSATLPNGTNLASMTIVPTIIKNGEGGSAAPTAAWAWGDNTYRVTDKDGDYTDYTITLTEAAAPSAAPVITAQPVGENYLEGAAIAALEVVATGESLTYQWYLGADAIDGATEATYTPAVSAIGSYVYHCVVTNTEAGHPATSLASDNATITIAEDPAAIKLIAANGDINTTDFITGVSKNTVNYGSVDHNCATFGSTASTAVGASGLNKFIIYNAKTDQTKIKFVLYNTQNSAQKLVLQKLAEGGDAMEEIEIDVPSKEEFTTEYYAYTSSANRTMYAFVKNTGIKVLQVKVIDNGASLKQFGQSGYSVNFNQGRLFLNSGTDGAYDGLTYNAASNFAPLSSTGLSLTKNKAYSFNVPAAATMTVTAANNAKYYITQTVDGEDNETAVAAATSFDLTAGTWYLRVAGSNLSVTNIAFTAPKCAEPAFNALANSDVCEGDGYVALNGTATVADAGVPTYQWYNADGDEAIDGATAAEFTPTADGSYYVIATNHLADHSDNAKQSATVTVTTFASAAITAAPQDQHKVPGQNATLTVTATGKAPLSYQWYTCDENGDNAVIIDGAEAASYEVEVTAGMSQYYKVVVSSGCGEASAVALVTEWHEVEPVNVTGSRVWNWTSAAFNGIDDAIAFGNTSVEELMANVSSKVPNYESFRSDMLYGTGQYVWRPDDRYFQGFKIRFVTTVPGIVKVTYRGTGNNKNIILTINDSTYAEYQGGFTTVKNFVQAGEVVIEGVGGTDNVGGMTRIQRIQFIAEADHERHDLNPNNIGTLCWTNKAVLWGGTLYELAGKDANNYLVFDEVEDNIIEAGKPYIFVPEDGNTEIKVFNTDDAEPMTEAQLQPVNHMYGTLEGKTLTQGPDDEMYYFSGRNIWRVADFNVAITIPAYRCYVDYPAVLAEEPAPAPAPGRRRITMGTNGTNVATGMENVQGDKVQCTKMLIDGQIFILRGEKMYDATGRLVK